MRTASGAPQVSPRSFRPERISGRSLSLRAVASFPPGARRAMNARTASQSGAKPAGRPSITAPMDGAWDWPKIRTR